MTGWSRLQQESAGRPMLWSDSSFTSASEKYVHGAGTAVHGARRHECHDVREPAQPKVHGGFENWAARARAIALAMDDSHAAAAAVAAARDEFGQLAARRHLTEPVKIQFIIDRVEAAAQPAHDLDAHAGALKGERLVAGHGIRRRSRFVRRQAVDERQVADQR